MEKKARAKILYFVPGWAGLGPKFQFLFLSGPKFVRAETATLRAGQGPDQKNPDTSSLDRPIISNFFGKNTANRIHFD